MRSAGSIRAAACWVSGARLAFGNSDAPLLRDLDDLHEKLSLAINLRDLQPCAARLQLAQRSALRLVGDTGIAAVASTPTAALLDEHHEGMVTVLQQGRIDYRLAGRLWTVEAGCSAIYLPGEAMRVRTLNHNGLVYNLNPPLLARHLIELRPRLTLERALVLLQRPWLINLRHPASQAALQQLTLVTRLLDVGGSAQPHFTILSLLHDRLYQLSARFLLSAIGCG